MYPNAVISELAYVIRDVQQIAFWLYHEQCATQNDTLLLIYIMQQPPNSMNEHP